MTAMSIVGNKTMIKALVEVGEIGIGPTYLIKNEIVIDSRNTFNTNPS
jgi:hypothetical protein